MAIPALLVRPFRSPCAGLNATITGHTAAHAEDPVCMSSGWDVESILTIAGTLGSFKIERQRTSNSAGTNWIAWNITQNSTELKSLGTGIFGTGGLGQNTTFYFKARARIVAADDTACGDWVESNGPITKTKPGCQT